MIGAPEVERRTELKLGFVLQGTKVFTIVVN